MSVTGDNLARPGACLARSLVAALLAGGLLVPASAQQQPAPAETPAKRFEALSARFNHAANGLWNAKTLGDKKRFTADGEVLSREMMALAEQNPTDPAAFPALVATCNIALWLENNTAYAGGPTPTVEQRAIAQLQRDYLQSQKLAEACNRLGYGFSAECEQLLRRALRESPHREVRGMACLKLAELLYARRQRLALIATRPDRERRYEGLFGKPFLDALRKRKPEDAAAEYEALYEQAARDYGDVKMPYKGTIGDQVALELNEIRSLAIGRPAPEIEGEDQHGLPFKLSDYRGKVVLLYFWQHT